MEKLRHCVSKTSKQLKLPVIPMEQTLYTWIWGIFWHSSLRILLSSVPAVSGAASTLDQVCHFPQSWALSKTPPSPPSPELRPHDTELRYSGHDARFRVLRQRCSHHSTNPTFEFANGAADQKPGPRGDWRVCLLLYRGVPCSLTAGLLTARRRRKPHITLNRLNWKQPWWGGASTLPYRLHPDALRPSVGPGMLSSREKASAENNKERGNTTVRSLPSLEDVGCHFSSVPLSSPEASHTH